jgi:signal transduction histidine kinase
MNDRAPIEATLALAHALRTPLTSLALGLGLLDDGALGALSDPQRDVVHALVGEVARLSLLVDRALSTDRLGAYAGPVDRRPVDLAELVRAASAPLEPQARDKGVSLKLALAARVEGVADPVKLGWVAASLVGNALRYSPRGAAIDVELSARGQRAVLSVRDRGPGLSAEDAARIFDRERGRGLFLAREIVEAHGGRIAVRSAPGKGCTFRVTLPRSGGATPARGARDGEER